MAGLLVIVIVVLGLSLFGLTLLAVWVGVKLIVGLLRLVGRMVGGVVTGIADAVRGVVGGISSGVRRVVLGKRADKVFMYACPRPACGEFNPREACFCRRCGRKMEAVVVEQRGNTTWVSPVVNAVVPPPIPGQPIAGQVVLSSWRR